jgi:hypothetical protein
MVKLAAAHAAKVYLQGGIWKITLRFSELWKKMREEAGYQHGNRTAQD